MNAARRDSYAIGDVMWAIAKLGPRDHATRLRINDLVLGLERADAPPSPPQPVTAPQRTRERSSDGWRRTLRRMIRRRAVGTSLSPILLGAGGAALAFIALIRGRRRPILLAVAVPAALGWWWLRRARVAVVPSTLRLRPDRFEVSSDDAGSAGVALLPLPGPDDPDPPLQPLLVPRWTSGILTGALAIDKTDGRLNVEAFVDALARMQTPTVLPRLRRRTLNDGADVLADVSEGMLPFDADVRLILERVRCVVGHGGVAVTQFDGYPLTQAFTASGAPPSPQMRRAVLALTNFGLSGPPEARDSAPVSRTSGAFLLRGCVVPAVRWWPSSRTAQPACRPSCGAISPSSSGTTGRPLPRSCAP